MKRTENRPIPQGALNTRQCLIFAFLIGALGMVVLVAFVNVLTAVLTFFSLIGYAVVYTMYLKRATPQNIVIGGAAGAMPPLLGWAAVTGEVTAGALLLFLIVFIWTPPHFWALYTVLLLIVTIFPYLIQMSGLLYLLAALVLGGRFLYHAWRLFDETAERQPMKTFVFSINYLMWLFGFMLVDHYLPLLNLGFTH